MNCPEFDPAWSPATKEIHATDLLELFCAPGARKRMEYRSRYMSRHDKVIALVLANVALGSRILDVAAGQGNFSIALAEHGYAVTWNDLRADLVDYVSAKDDRKLLTYLPGNAFDLSEPGAFDAVVATEIIEHVAHPDDFIRQLASLVRPGGHLIMTTPNGASLANQIPGRRLPRWSNIADVSLLEQRQFKPDADGHLFLLHEDEIRRFAEQSGLEVVSFDYISNPLTVGRWKLRHVHPLLGAAFVDAAEARSRRLPRAIRRRLMDISAFVLRKPASP